MRRRYRTNHANVRSTTQRRVWTLKPPLALAVIVTAQRHTLRTNSWNRLENPLSAITSRTRASRCRTPPSSQRPPSRSWTSAVSTDSAQTNPSQSTPMNRLRPLTFFPPVVPLRAAAVGRLDRLAVHPQCLWGRRGAGLDTNLSPKCGVNLLPNPGQAPVAEQAVDGLPRRQVAGNHPPRPAGPQVVED